MRSKSSRNIRIVGGAIVLAFVAAVAAIFIGKHASHTGEQQDIAWVLELTGAGWTLEGHIPRRLQVGDRLPARGVITPINDDEATTITICDFEGKATRFVGRDRSQTLPDSASAGFGSKLWRRIADSFESKDIHAISRGDQSDHLNSSIAVQNDQEKVDLSPMLSAWPASPFLLQFKPVGNGANSESGAAIKSKIDWDPQHPQTALSPKLDPGLYSVELQGADTGADAPSCLILVCARDDFSTAEDEFNQCVSRMATWPEEIREALGEQNRRACLRALASGRSIAH